MCSKQRSGRGSLDPANIWDHRQSPILPKVNELKVLHQPAALGLAFREVTIQSRQVIEMNPSSGLRVVVMGVDINSDILVLQSISCSGLGGTWKQVPVELLMLLPPRDGWPKEL